MPVRRSHQKSKAGCLTCKRRHVKCDETGPPCGSCKSRGTPCDYPSPASTIHTSSSSNETAATDIILAEWPIAAPKFPTNSRLLELQLMSRWCSETYKSLVTKIAEDDPVWLRRVPDLALEHDFLLNGILALSAFEIASTADIDPTPYVDAGREYQGAALLSYRQHLDSVNDENFEPALLFSMMLLVLAFASAQFTSISPCMDQDTMVQKTLVHCELIRGCEAVVLSNKAFIEQSPYVKRLKSFEELQQMPLNLRVDTAMTKLSEINEKRLVDSVDDAYESRVQQITNWKACKNAISMLRECFGKLIDGHYDGYSLAWLNLSGDDYIQALKSYDHTALLVLMYWGVLVQKLGHQVWWAKNFGNQLIEEISNQQETGSADTLTKEVISLAQEIVEMSSEGFVAV